MGLKYTITINFVKADINIIALKLNKLKFPMGFDRFAECAHDLSQASELSFFPVAFRECG